MMNLSMHVPLAAPDAQPTTMLEFARRSKAAGVGGLFTLDRLVFNNQEPLMALAAAAAVAPGMTLGISVLLGTLRPPALLAKMAATLNQINGHEVILGLGVGSRADDFAAAETPYEHRGSRLEEAIAIMRLCWSGKPVKFSGRFYNIDVGPIGPRPLSGSALPIWLGGGSTEPALRRIGRIADGYIASSSGGPGGFRDKWDAVQRYAEQAGRDPASIYPAGLIYVCVDDDVARAEEVTTRYFQHYYAGSRPTRGGAILGSADACVRGLNEYLQAGLRYPIIGSPTADLAYLDRFLEQVLPRLEG
jgi:alkanesulfonate monooxygenase SsuD/methylene tetrahydromethanopterin reductase-like flavin-dependent oxidoreductase (luciferase family)